MDDSFLEELETLVVLLARHISEVPVMLHSIVVVVVVVVKYICVEFEQLRKRTGNMQRFMKLEGHASCMTFQLSGMPHSVDRKNE